MRHYTDPEDRYPTRTLAILTVFYVVAAGCNGVVAVVYRARWHGVLAVVLVVAASGFLAYTVRNARLDRVARRPIVPPARRDGSQNEREPAPIAISSLTPFGGSVDEAHGRREGV